MKVISNFVCLLALLCGCGSSTTSTFQITTAAGAAPSAVAGDAIKLQVIEAFSDGTFGALPAGTNVVFSGPPTIIASTTAMPGLPPFGATPTAAFVSNPARTDRGHDDDDVVYFLDAGSGGGSVSVTATITGAKAGTATVSIPVGATPAGDATRGATTFGSTGADCANCHGDTGAGTPLDPNGTTYTIANMTYDYPAPGLNAAPGNVAANPDWNAALLAFAARSNVDKNGVFLRDPMPDWLTQPGPANKPLTTQDFADIYAFLKTQTH